jgi:hypothetical protein
LPCPAPAALAASPVDAGHGRWRPGRKRIGGEGVRITTFQIEPQTLNELAES